MVGSVVGASRVAKQLGAAERGQILACLTSAFLAWGSHENPSRFQYALWTGLSLGLAALTKPTAYVFALPIVVSLAVALIKQCKSKALLPLLTTIVLALLINLPFAIRNTVQFGTPAVDHCVYGPGYRPSNDSFAPKYVISNIMRNLTTELQTPVPVSVYLPDKIELGGAEERKVIK